MSASTYKHIIDVYTCYTDHKLQRSFDSTFSQIKVILPSGAKVTATHHPWGLNVHLRAPGDDAENTAGLCGDFNGEKNDEFRKGGDKQAHADPVSFAKSWRYFATRINETCKQTSKSFP